jgi:nitrogen fixation protein FixH
MSDFTIGASSEPDETNSEGRPLKGRTVLAILLVFFGVVGSANALMIHYAISSFRGEVANHPYEVGLAYNSEIAAARAQNARNWRVAAKIVTGTNKRRLDVWARDAQGQPISGLSMIGIFVSPVDGMLDRRVGLTENSIGTYSGDIAIAPGYWGLEILAKEGGTTLFQSKNRIHVE